MDTMSIYQVAAELHNTEYDKPFLDEYVELLRQAGIVVVTGLGDDIMLFRGAINDGVSCSKGGIAYINENGLIRNECSACDCPYHAEILEKAKTIKAIWSAGSMYCWTFNTDIHHAEFDILENGLRFCRGIVFNLNSLDKKNEK